MIQITNVIATDEHVDVFFSAGDFPLSARVYDADKLAVDEIQRNAWEQVKPHYEYDCIQREVEPETELQLVEDTVTSITVLGVEDVNFTEGQQPIEKSYRCAGHTRFGKTLDLKDLAVFDPRRDVTIAPTCSAVSMVSASYGDLTDTKQFSVNYSSLQDIADRELVLQQEEVERKATALAYGKKSKKDELDKICNAEIIAGFTSTVKFGEPKLYELQIENQLNMVGIFNDIALSERMGLAMAETVSYYPKGEPCTEYTISEFMQLCKEATAFKTEKINKYKALIVQLEACATEEEVSAVAW